MGCGRLSTYQMARQIMVASRQQGLPLIVNSKSCGHSQQRTAQGEGLGWQVGISISGACVVTPLVSCSLTHSSEHIGLCSFYWDYHLHMECTVRACNLNAQCIA